MAFIDVAEWTAIQTTEWLSGLDDCILPYVQFFLNNDINGRRLLVLSSSDLSRLTVTKVGHQEIILEAVRLLRHLHFDLFSETLQTLALQLGCKARSLYNQLKYRNSFDGQSYGDSSGGELSPHTTEDIGAKVSTETLSAVSDIMASVKPLISWIDRHSFHELEDYIPVRKAILKQSLELASTAQRDRFVDRPNHVIKAKCIFLADVCDWIVQESDDSLAIQTAVLEVVKVKKEANEELGLSVRSSYNGVHVISAIRGQSPAQRFDRIDVCDQIVQINYQTVLGWHHNNVMDMIYICAQNTTKLWLTLKKVPRHSDFPAEVTALEPFKIPNRRIMRSDSEVRDSSTSPRTEDQTVSVDLNQKRRHSVRRRASTSGSSPPLTDHSIKLEDLLKK